MNIQAWDRNGLERLVGYCARPALSQQRLVYSEKTNTVIYRTAPKDGKSEILVMPPAEFLRRWTLLMPPPNKNLIRYYGALAPRSPLRPVVVAKVEKETALLAGQKKVDKPKKKNSWAACLARISEVFPLLCTACNLEMKPVAVILNDKELVRLLTHLGMPSEFPVFPAKLLGGSAFGGKTAPQSLLYEHACGPPDDCRPDPQVDYEAIEPAPADD